MDIIGKILFFNKKIDGDNFIYLTKDNFDNFKRIYLEELNVKEKYEK